MRSPTFLKGIFWYPSQKFNWSHKLLSSAHHTLPKFFASAPKCDHRLSIAPMMEYTDRHFRYFMRLLTTRTVLYSEMVVDNMILNGSSPVVQRSLERAACESPVVLQLGGCNPDTMGRAVRKLTELGFQYDELNLNCGCPSPTVAKEGQACAYAFGAALMKEPSRVAAITDAMMRESGLPVSVKCRIGVDDMDSYESLCKFVETVSKSGVHHFIIHARIALLKGLSPDQNRKIPPLKYDYVSQLVREFPELRFTLNGGVHSLDQVSSFLQHGIQGVMIGREATVNPWLFAEADTKIFEAENALKSRESILQMYSDYCDRQLSLGAPWTVLKKPAFQLYHGLPGAKQFRRVLGESASFGTWRTSLEGLSA